jgi:hypothetical protein
MTVGELRKTIEGLDPKMPVAAYFESDGNRETEFFDLADVSVGTGTPVRSESTHKAGFRFENTGPAKWLLIRVEEA